MKFVPLALSIAGLLLGPVLARALHNCPHRGKVWGAFLLPLLALVSPSLQMLALGTSLGAALAAGLTAHRPLSLSFVAVSTTNLAVTLAIQGL